VPKPEACGFRLASPIQAAWTGQRDPAVLTVGLDVTVTALAQGILVLLEPGAGA
jgi:hypothetical protein